ncbi:hypothetical protein [Paenibacillus sp. S28]|uniref:hypothetical protein n=1 Tax=Paenibacillus sp. S28 TaxID=2767463 RepID=UPI00190E3C64|nr:hypothetical protein [Paenibacillus sp. S28]MBJ9989434.1 hypothetical protein [Paenibacillus sp. S28]
MRIKSTIALSLVFLLCIGLFLYFYDFPKQINVDRAAVIFTKDNPSPSINTKVMIKGTLYRPIFHQEKFVGKVIVDSYPFTKVDSSVEIYVTQKTHGIRMGNLFYQQTTPNFLGTEQALIWFDNEFENINIWPTTPWGDTKRDENVFIVTKSNYEQAINMQKMMREKFGINFVPK